MNHWQRHGIIFRVTLALVMVVFIGNALRSLCQSPTLASIAVFPSQNGGFGTSDGILTQGTEVPFIATGFYSDNSTQDITTSVTWTSSNTAVAMIGTNTGITFGVGTGTAQITASLSGVTSTAITVTVAGGTLEGVAITPAAAGVAAGATMQLIAYGNYEVSGETNPFPTILADLTHEVSWNSSNTSVATVSSTGLVTGIAAGTVTITATMPGFTGTSESAIVTVVPAPPNWIATGNLFHQRAGHSATLLSDGTVLLAGGEDSLNKLLNLAEIYSPSSGLFTLTTGTMVDDRVDFTATLLPDHTVLLAGGGGVGTGGGSPQNTAEIYNPSTGLFTATVNNMSANRSGATATLLNNGLVLIAGGDGAGSSADLYDPSLQTFSPTGALNIARTNATATLLPNGEVLIVGGHDESSETLGALSSAELYDPTAGTFTLLTATMAFPRVLHTATLLNTGQVLIAGGSSNLGSASTPPAYEELYDPATQTFLRTGALNAPRIFYNAVLLADGTVLLAGGGAPNNLTGLFGQSFPPQATAEIYNPATGLFAFTANMNFQRAAFTATLLPNGSILAAGGQGIGLFPATAEIYIPNSTSPALVSIAVTPSAASIAAGNTQAFTATGTYSNSTTQNITSTVTWASSNTSAATIAPGGVATGVAAGMSSITASLSGVTSNSANLTVNAPTLTSIAITPTTASIAAGNTQAFTATGTYSNSTTQNITSTVTWASSNTSAATIAPGGVATGVAAGMSSITASLSGVTSNSANLTVTSTAGVATVSPSTLTFGTQTDGTTSASQTVTLSNVGNGSLTINSIVVAGSFGETNNCASSLGIGGSCKISVTFSPKVAGLLTGTVTITDNNNQKPGSIQTVTLSGTGSPAGTNPGARLSPTSLTFDKCAHGSSTTQKVTLSSTGTTNLNISKIGITGIYARDFTETNNCPATLAPGATCTIYVTFTPNALGTATATLTVSDNAPNSPQTTALSGNGVKPF
ncbi:MAG: choice-of-anchor D domain-containing protein [Terracidiphilus sp.]